MTVFMLLVDGECDQIVETRELAERTKKDLKKLDCGTIKIKEFPTWQEAHAYEDKLRGL